MHLLQGILDAPQAGARAFKVDVSLWLPQVSSAWRHCSKQHITTLAEHTFQTTKLVPGSILLPCFCVTAISQKALFAGVHQ